MESLALSYLTRIRKLIGYYNNNSAGLAYLSARVAYLLHTTIRFLRHFRYLPATSLVFQKVFGLKVGRGGAAAASNQPRKISHPSTNTVLPSTTATPSYTYGLHQALKNTVLPSQPTLVILSNPPYSKTLFYV